MICHMTRLVFRRMKDDQVDNKSCNMEEVVRRVLEVVNLEVESKLGTIVPTTKNFSSIGHLGAEIIQPEQNMLNKMDNTIPLSLTHQIKRLVNLSFPDLNSVSSCMNCRQQLRLESFLLLVTGD